mmetsp:Transcript_28918/g.75718  ORF Transcript_28918/g.75718 Transcript_28918/m.75718 type:complete len:152 (-) Transcript_28918:112-567(-)
MAPAVPDLLLGPSFTLLAVLLLAAAILTSLALVSVEMKPVRLYEALCAALRPEEEEEKAMQQAEAGQDAGHPKKRSKPRRLRLPRLKYFFLADRRSAPDSLDSPYELDDCSWITPDPPSEGPDLEVFELPDEQWVSPAAPGAGRSAAAAER